MKILAVYSIMLPPLMRPQKFAAKAMAEKVIRIVRSRKKYNSDCMTIGQRIGKCSKRWKVE